MQKLMSPLPMALEMDLPASKSLSSRHINNRYINSYYTFPVNCNISDEIVLLRSVKKRTIFGVEI
jgi:ribosomal protein S26